MKFIFINFWFQRYFCFKLFLTLFALALPHALLQAQQVTATGSSTTLFNTKIKHLDIILENHQEIYISTTKNKNYRISDSQHGELKEALLITNYERNDSLFIVDATNPTYTFKDDKLGAHKVINGKITIEVPENTSVFIQAHSAVVHIAGLYKTINGSLKNGDISFNMTGGDVFFNTIYGDIIFKGKDYHVTSKNPQGAVSTAGNSWDYKFKAKIETLYGHITATL